MSSASVQLPEIDLLAALVRRTTILPSEEDIEHVAKDLSDFHAGAPRPFKIEYRRYLLFEVS